MVCDLHVHNRPGTCKYGHFSIYTAILKKVVGKIVHATIPRGNMGYDQYTVPDTIAVQTTFAAFV